MQDKRINDLFKLGWMRGIDIFFALMLVAMLTGMCVDACHFQNIIHVMAWLLSTAVLLISWLIVLVFRCMYFVIKLSNDVQLMPEAASKIVAAMLSRP